MSRGFFAFKKRKWRVETISPLTVSFSPLKKDSSGLDADAIFRSNEVSKVSTNPSQFMTIKVDPGDEAGTELVLQEFDARHRIKPNLLLHGNVCVKLI